MDRSHLKRPFEDKSGSDSDSEPSADKRSQRKVRFPKGKKIKPLTEPGPINRLEDDQGDHIDPRIAAKQRAKHRHQITAELLSEENRGILTDISAAEVDYEETARFVQDGIKIEPFNLKQEREEGYFDTDGNFVEYANKKEIRDAWLDNVEVDPKLAERVPFVNDDDASEPSELTSREVGKIKRRIADFLEPGETVLQALRRLKGTSTSKKDKMSAETKHLFDQLTEDAMRLMENGDSNVYHEKQEMFEREAEGYERNARASGAGTSVIAQNGVTGTSTSLEQDLFSYVTSNAAEKFDMFAEDDENTNDKPLSNDAHLDPAYGTSQNDYVYDESTGYYYSSSLGYYYDPSSGLYCCATSGQWYAYSEETGAYQEVRMPVPSNETLESSVPNVS